MLSGPGAIAALVLARCSLQNQAKPECEGHHCWRLLPSTEGEKRQESVEKGIRKERAKREREEGGGGEGEREKERERSVGCDEDKPPG